MSLYVWLDLDKSLGSAFYTATVTYHIHTARSSVDSQRALI